MQPDVLGPSGIVDATASPQQKVIRFSVEQLSWPRPQDSSPCLRHDSLTLNVRFCLEQEQDPKYSVVLLKALFLVTTVCVTL